MELIVLKQEFSVCQVADFSQVNLSGDYTFIAQTPAENSLVCPTSHVPPNCTRRDDGWRGFYIAGQLDFSLIGIMADLSAVLADNQIGLFAVSTYNTDYIFTKADSFQRALTALATAGYKILPPKF